MYREECQSDPFFELFEFFIRSFGKKRCAFVRCLCFDLRLWIDHQNTSIAVRFASVLIVFRFRKLHVALFARETFRVPRFIDSVDLFCVDENYKTIDSNVKKVTMAPEIGRLQASQVPTPVCAFNLP